MQKIKVVLEALLSFTMGINLPPIEIFAEEAKIPEDYSVFAEHVHDEHCNHEHDYGLILWQDDHIHLNESTEDKMIEQEEAPEATELPSLDEESEVFSELSDEFTIGEQIETKELPEESENQNTEEDAIIQETDFTESSEPMATCSHTYSASSYTVLNHTQHTKKCTKCGTVTKENHNWSGDKCSNCGCYKPFTSNGTYDVIASSGVQLYSGNSSGTTKVKVVPKDTAITVTNVATASSGYYWGKVTKVGTSTQSSEAYVCMKSSELKVHSHSNTTSYEAAGHTQHTKTTTCTKCGATSTVKENHNWSGDKCSNCGCYKPFTSNGTYDVTASAGVPLYSDKRENSTLVRTVPKDTAITVTDVAATNSGYYWGKVTKIGTASQTSPVYVCMRSSTLKTHTHNHEFSYNTKNNILHTIKITCPACGETSTETEPHNFNNGVCTKCSAWEPYKVNGGYVVVNEKGISTYPENKEEHGKEIRALPKG
ncbi:MAG: hypothetical protein K6F23_11235, partial [Solobacterium sp.]|nr:hypothetical protein [Solobacterium sp.]